MLQADCLSVKITADTNRLLMLLLKPVSVRPRSSNLSLSPMIYWQHCICLPLPLQAEFLTNPVPGYQPIIKNVWQDLRAVRDGFSEAGRAGEDEIRAGADLPEACKQILPGGSPTWPRSHVNYFRLTHSHTIHPSVPNTTLKRVCFICWFEDKQTDNQWGLNKQYY